MDGNLMENTEIVENTYSNTDSFNDEEPVIHLAVSEKGLKKIEAAAFYNDYENITDYIRDVLFGEIEIDKQRHLKGKESKEANKFKK